MMANLLDKSSIVLTPTAYDNGKVLCVKPSDGSGDFDFSRNSSATRVNAQGLVEDVQILSSNLVQNPSFSEEGAEEVSNGSFTNGSTDWTLGTGWSIGEDKAICIGNSGHTTLTQNNSFLLGKTYKVTFDIVVDSGNFKIQLLGGGADSGNIISSTQVGYTEYISPTANRSSFGIRSNDGNGIGSITNISVKEVLQDWSVVDYGAVSASAVITPNTEGVKLEKTVSADWRSSFLVQPISYTNGSQYKATFKLKNGNLPSGGGVYVRRAYDSSSQSIVNNLTLTNDWVEYTYYFVADSNSVDISFGEVNWENAGVGQYFYIDDVSVIEITDDTNLPRINYEGFSYQDALGPELISNGDFATDDNWVKGTGWNISGGSANGSNTTSDLYQENVVESGKYYKVTYTISNYVSGTVRVELPSNAFSGIERSANGTYTETILSGGTLILFDARTSFTGSIDNVSVKEYLGQEVVPDSGCGSLLFEGQSTNLIPYSELFSDASWTKQQITITQNATISPSGLIDASMISEDNTNNYHRIRKNISLSVDATLSIFAKKGTIDKFLLWSGSNGVGFDLTLGTINNVSGLNPPSSSSIKDFGNGWYRCSITDNSISAFEVFSLQDFSGFVYQGSSANNFYIWGAQIEQQSYPTSYIPTEGTTVTRNQDVCTNGGSAALISSTEGVLYADIASLTKINPSGNITLSDGTGNNRIYIYYLIDNSISVIYNVNSTGASINNFLLANITEQTKIAVRWGNSNVSVWINGTSVLSNTTSNFLPNTLNVLSFAKPAGSGNFNGKTKALAVFPYLSDTELAELTTI